MALFQLVVCAGHLAADCEFRLKFANPGYWSRDVSLTLAILEIPPWSLCKDSPRRDFILGSIPASPGKRPFTFKDALQGFLLLEDLPFASILDSERIHEIFRKHKSLFGGIYETTLVLWAFLGQVLRDGKEASCQSAVGKITAFPFEQERHRQPLILATTAGSR